MVICSSVLIIFYTTIMTVECVACIAMFDTVLGIIDTLHISWINFHQNNISWQYACNRKGFGKHVVLKNLEPV
jgi:hypothetical protein